MAAHGAGGGWGYGDDDDWGLSAEQLDQIERDAIRQLAERKASSAAASTARSPASALGAISPLPSRATAPAAAATSPFGANHPAARASLEARFGKIEAVSPSRPYDPNTSRNAVNNSQGSSPKISVHISLHSSGVIAAKFPYNQLLVDAFHKIPKASWNAKERVWMFPPSSLSIAEEVLGSVPGLAVEVRKLDPLVQRALLASLSTKDLRDLYDRIPADVESKLMPFQREGIRFVLQHGGRALIADEMGLGKTLQTIQNWLNIPMEDILIVIADESHFMKNCQAKRTIASLPVLQKAQYAVLLSGTPALSRPIELFTQLQALYPAVYKNVNEYGNRYCKGGFFGLYQGASNREELHNLMKATVMIRRLKKDVLTQLPVKRRQQVFLDLSEKDVKHVRAIFRELETLKIKIESSESKEMTDSLKFTQKNLINKLYTDSATAKTSAVLDFLGTMVELSIKAGGYGLTLTAASTVIFAELSWTPGDLIQAEDRAHRIGQVSSVNVYYLLANETVDDLMWDVVQGKLENLGQVLDGQEKTLDVSQIDSRPSPSKQQKTLDGFLKRCNTSTEDQPSTKHLRF
nr:unnamed protein product [Digitaria exilis]